jgi:phosphoglycerate dehydrogenase-like enzyme
MPDIAPTTPLVIAHQLSGEFERRLDATLPPGIEWRALPPGAAWEVPEDANVLLAVPPRGGQIIVPPTRPPGWPHRLQWIQAVSAGVDEYPKWIFDVPLVTCGRGTNSVPIAEFVFAAMLAVTKKLPEIWIDRAADWKLTELGTLENKTLGLVGFGSIGRAVAVRARSFGMNILATRRSASDGAGENGVTFVSLETVLTQADHLVIALPLTAATAGLIGRAALAQVKPGVHLINISRGRILDQAALLEALDANRVGIATLDVTEPEPLPAGHALYTHPRVHLSPHLSWSNGERGQAFTAYFAENLRRFLQGQPLQGVVDPAAGY